MSEASEPSYESLFNRGVAALLDDAVWLVAAFWILGSFPRSTYTDHPEVVGAVFLVLASAWFNYFAICEWRYGQTIGKRAMGMRVVTVEGKKLSYGAASIRNLLRIVDFFFVGPIMIATSARRQRLGDRLAGTVVIRTRRYEPPAHRPPAAAQGGDSAESQGRQRDGLSWVTWGPRRALWGVVAGLGLGVLVVPIPLLPFDPDLDSLGVMLIAQLLLDTTLAATAVYFVRDKGKFELRSALERLGWRRFRPSAFGAAIGTLFLYFIAVAIYASIFVTPSQKNIGGQLGLHRGVLASIAAVVLIVGAAPIAEESFFRGFLFGGLRTRLPLWPAALISGLLFGGVHAPEGPTAVVPLAILGVALAALYERTGSLGPCVFAHMVNNSLALAVSG